MSTRRRTPRRRGAVAFLLVAAAVVGAGGCSGRGSPPPAGPAPRLSRSAATAIVRSYAAAWGSAASTWDRAALRRIQTGAALAVSLTVTFQTTMILAVEVPPAGARGDGKLRVVALREQDLSATTSTATA